MELTVDVASNDRRGTGIQTFTLRYHNGYKPCALGQDRSSLEEFVEDKLAAPLRALSPLGVEGVELSADIYAGEDLK